MMPLVEHELYPSGAPDVTPVFGGGFVLLDRWFSVYSGLFVLLSFFS
jgi:hypothetical protein